MLATDTPIHIHVAEQVAEVDELLSHTGQRPVDWLLALHDLSSRWCLIHATQMTPVETLAMAASGAVAGLCPITEGNLGDGIFGGVGRTAQKSALGLLGQSELRQIWDLIKSSGYDDGRIRIDPSVVRGLEYYTGPVFEAELTFEVKDEDSNTVRFGSVGGGGRYDDLVARFTGEKVPATGFSIGVSRLQAALAHVKGKAQTALGPVVVLVMDKGEIASYQNMVQTLRNAGVRAEMYLGSSGMKAQMKYADKRNAPCVIIQGSDERAKGEVTLKDLIEGAKAAAAIKDNKEWKEARPAQLAVPEKDLVAEVKKIVARHAV